MSPRTAIVTRPIALDALVAAVSHPGAGAVATFLGTVRDTNAGLTVTLLEYHVYERLAEAELASIAHQVEAELPGVRVACEHRVGTLVVGDVAVACAASSSIASRRASRSGSASTVPMGPTGSGGTTRAAATATATVTVTVIKTFR